jgi:serine/threonine protein kinase
VLGHEVDQRTDLFSLGVVLYDMVAGRLPFRGSSPTETMDQILHAEPEAIARFNRDVAAELERIVRKCLEKGRELRYQHASDICADLKHLQRDTESRWAVAAPAQTGRKRYAKLAATLVVAGALAVAGWFWLGRSRPASDGTQLKVVPLTSYPGSEDSPSFSPDGSQVAFSWNGEKQDNVDIYIKQIGMEPPFRLTTDPAEDLSPAWSPDGRFIAFLRILSPIKRAIMYIPQRGGRERPLAEYDCSSVGGSHLDRTWHGLQTRNGLPLLGQIIRATAGLCT